MSHVATVTRVEGTRFWVDFLGEEVPCRLHGEIGWKLDEAADFVVAGDEVEIERQDDDTYVVRDARPSRRRVVSRMGSRLVAAANVDCLVVVEAVDQPAFNRTLVERLLDEAGRNGAQAIVVVNKCDLADDREVRAMIAPLLERGAEVVLTSARTGFGLEELKSRLQGKVSLVVGRPRTGKSRIIEALYPGYVIEDGPAPVGLSSISRRSAGSSRLHPVPGGGYLAL